MKTLSWRWIAYLAWEQQSKRCRLCGKQIYMDACFERRLVGHHIIPRSRGGLNSLENCQARHGNCEVWAHRVHPTGNPTREQIKAFRLGRHYLELPVRVR